VRFLSLLTLFPQIAQACAICGLNESFSPKMLLIGLGFVLIPMAFAAFVGWRVWKDAKRRSARRNAPAPTEGN